MVEAKRRITKFDFSNNGAHVALVDEAANGQSVLIMKSLKAPEEEIKKSLDKTVTVKMNIMEFLTRWLDLYYDDAEVVASLLGYSKDDLGIDASEWVEYLDEKISSIQINKSQSVKNFTQKFEDFKTKFIHKSQNFPANVTEHDNPETQPIAEEHMTVETQEQTTKELIQKAAKEIADSQIAALTKQYEDRATASENELKILKAAHEARMHQEYVTKAEELATYIGEDVDKEALAKSLRAVEALEEGAEVMAALKALKSTADKQELFVEVGKSATKDQTLDIESQVTVIAKSLRENDPTLTVRQAEMRAYEQLVS